MTKEEFEEFVQAEGANIIKYCKLITNDNEIGNDLYQDTMLVLLKKLKKLRVDENHKSYAISVANLLWKNQKRKYANRQRIASIKYFDDLNDGYMGYSYSSDEMALDDQIVLNEELEMIRELVSTMPDKYRLPIYMKYSSDMTIEEIAKSLQVPSGTIKSRIRKAKQILQQKMLERGY